MKEKIPSDETESDETQAKQDDEMEIEQGDGHDAASPVTEQSRRDRKFWKSHMYSTLTVPDKRKASEAASTFSESMRDRKRTRDGSQPVDEDEPGKFPTLPLPFPVSKRMNRSCAPPWPAACY
jgi:hypothetical protein